MKRSLSGSGFLSSQDIHEALRSGKKELMIPKGTVITDLAAETAREASLAIKEIQEADMLEAKIPEADIPSGVSADGDAFDLLLAGGNVIIPEIGAQRVNVAIRGGKIAALTSERPKAARTVELAGKYVLPGIVDPHIHLGLFVSLDKELRMESRAALLGGVTSAGCFFNQPESYRRLLAELSVKVPSLSHIDILPHLTLREPLHLHELPEYRSAGVRSFKMYMCGIPGILPHQDDAFILKAMERIASVAPDALLCVHAENSSIVESRTGELFAGLAGLAGGEAQVTLRSWGASHPEISEEEAAARAVLFAARTGVRLYLVHVGTKAAVEFLASPGKLNKLNKKDRRGVSVETTSPYLTLYDDAQSVNLKMVPPIRNRETVDALWNAIEEGVIDTIGTDNTTLTMQEKGRDMRDAVPGYPALGTHLVSVLNEGVARRGLPIEKIVPLMTLNPARVLGLYPRKGTILPGSDADLTVVDMDMEKKVTAALGGRSDFALHEGETLRGWPVMTIKAGNVAAEDGQLTGYGAASRGQLLRA